MEHEPEGRQNAKSLTVADGLRLARRYWIGIIAFVAASTAVAFAWYLVQPKVYAADSSGIVVAGGADNLGLSLAGDNLAKAKVKAYKSVAESLLVADRVAKDLGLGASGGAVAGGVTVTVPQDTAELRVSARSTDPQMAQRIADAWVVALAAQVRELEQASSSSATAEPAVRVVPLAKASLPGAPVSPNLKLALGIGGGAGLLLGLGYALLRGYVDRRIRTVGEVERTTGLPVIGTLPTDTRLSDGSHILEAPRTGDGGSHAMGEALRELRTNLQFIDVDHPPRIILVTSSVPSEGKSTVVGNLAAAMASAGENVIVVDGDLRRPTVHEVFDVVPGVGVTDVLSGRASVDEVLQSYPGLPNLQVLGAGRIPPNPSELLGSRMMQNLLTHLAEGAIVLIDAPPLLPVTDAAVLSRSAHGTIIVARAGKTTTDSLERAVGNLERVRGKVLGVILNGVSTKGPESYTYGYYGTYSQEQRGHEKEKPQKKASKAKAESRRKGAARKPQATPALEPAGLGQGPVPAPETIVEQDPRFGQDPSLDQDPRVDHALSAGRRDPYAPDEEYAQGEDYAADEDYAPEEKYAPGEDGLPQAASAREETAHADSVTADDRADFASGAAVTGPDAKPAADRTVRAFPTPQLVVSEGVSEEGPAEEEGEVRAAGHQAAADAPVPLHGAGLHAAPVHDAAPSGEPRAEVLGQEQYYAVERHDRSHNGLRFTITRPQPIVSAAPVSRRADAQSEEPDSPAMLGPAPKPSAAPLPGRGVQSDDEGLVATGEDSEPLWLPVQVRGRRSAG